MTCRDFQRKWDELLDADARRAAVRSAATAPPPAAVQGLPEPDEASLLAHVAACPGCRPIAARYQVLRHAIHAWRQPPVPPADLVRKVLSTPADDAVRPWRRRAARSQREIDQNRYRRRILGGLVASLAACILLAMALSQVDRSRARSRGVIPAPGPVVDLHSIAPPQRTRDDAPALNRALADATSATWDLARSATEPAARISRGVIDAATTDRSVMTDGSNLDNSATPDALRLAASSPTESLSDLGVVPSLSGLAPDPASMLQEVGGRLSAGVQPLSTGARQAFGFLLGPDRKPAEPRTTRPTSS